MARACRTATGPYLITGHGGTVYDFSDVVYPQDVRNCTTCHEENDADTPQASNWRLVANRAACGTCHDDVDFAGGHHPGGSASPTTRSASTVTARIPP